MTASRLSIYNDALTVSGERTLSTLSDNVETRYLLDQVWNSNGVRKCLELGQWHFAMRGVQVDYDTSITPDFGYARAFTKPSDWVLTSALCSDEFFRVPVTRYTDEAGNWYSDLDTIYVRYVSDDSNYGGNYANWPESFEELVALYFASKIILKISNDDKRTQLLLGLYQKQLKVAKNRAAMAMPTSFPATGGWVRARARGGNNSRDGGGTGGNLIG